MLPRYSYPLLCIRPVGYTFLPAEPSVLLVRHEFDQTLTIDRDGATCHVKVEVATESFFRRPPTLGFFSRGWRVVHFALLPQQLSPEAVRGRLLACMRALGPRYWCDSRGVPDDIMSEYYSDVERASNAAEMFALVARREAEFVREGCLFQ